MVLGDWIVCGAFVAVKMVIMVKSYRLVNVMCPKCTRDGLISLIVAYIEFFNI